MRNTQHTPGPWHFDPTSRDGANGLIRCNIGTENGGNGIVIARNVSCDNAPLIAAAPELQSAARLALSTLITAEALKEIPPGLFEKTKARLRAAIAKAEAGE